MEYRIIQHLKTRTDFTLYSAYQLNRILKGLITREVDTLFIATMNDQKGLYNLHLFPSRGLNSFKSQLTKLNILCNFDRAAYISIAYNIHAKSDKLDKEYKKAVQKVIDERSIDYVPKRNLVRG